MRIRKLKDRDALKNWSQFTKDFATSSSIDKFEKPGAKRKRVEGLLKDFPSFCKYYFPKVANAPFAKWHIEYANYVIKNDQSLSVIMCARDMAKSSVTSMLVLYLYYNKEFKSLGMFSYIKDQAEGLLMPIKKAFERNPRLINDFGPQQSIGDWTAKKFVTVTGVSFRAIGAGINPRGEKGEDADRFDLQIFDDFDDPEVCMNPERLDKNWKYVEGDCIPAMHVSGKRRIIALNNKIDEDCIIQRFWNKAKIIEKELSVKPKLIKVNLTDSRGKSNWVAYTDQECKEMIALAGDEAETEYFNNPSLKGKVFQKDWFVFKKLPPLKNYKYLVAYHDGGFKKTKTSDTKALVLVGYHNHEYHVRKVYVSNASISEAIGWHYDLDAFRKNKNAAFPFYMEEVFLLDLLYEHFDRESDAYGYRLPIQGDKRKKPDKDLRISNTAGHFERGQVYFDASLEHDRHTRQLIDQYLRFRTGVKTPKDGPDAMEGAFHLLQQMAASSAGFSYVLPKKSLHHI